MKHEIIIMNQRRRQFHYAMVYANIQINKFLTVNGLIEAGWPSSDPNLNSCFYGFLHHF